MLITNLTILVLAGFVGFAVISKVPNTLHTPLMSGTNAIHGIVLLGGLLVIGFSGNSTFNKVILVIAIAFGTINVVGGFLVTDRMLEMFKRKPELVTNLTILVLAGFVGFAVISKVPNTLHTPLMSGTNAIHGIVLLGGLLVIGFAGNSVFNKIILVIAIAFGTINVVGGFLVTDRMLEMFKRKPGPRARTASSDARDRLPAGRQLPAHPLHRRLRLFIYGLSGLTGPRTAVRGNRIAAVGMAIAVIATLLDRGEGNWALIVIGVAIGTAVGVPAARRVKMTAMPQMVALFNGVGGGAVFLIAWAEFRNTRRLPAARRSTSRCSRCSRRSSARSPSGARTSPSASCRSCCRAGRSRSAARQQLVNGLIAGRRGGLGGGDRGGLALRAALRPHADRRRGARQPRRAADRRRRHAGRDLAAERVHRPLGGGDRASRSTTRR